jgi:alpha-glucosidase/alpha-D-xyloside xylohydrolase
MLSSLSPGTLRISIAPANDALRLPELGVVESTQSTPLYSFGRVRGETVQWGKYTIRVSDKPLRITVLEDKRIRQEIRFEPDSTNVKFDLDGPVFGLGEGVHPFDRRDTRDAMFNGQHSPDLQTFGARLPIPWVISPAGWGVFVGQPHGSFVFTQTEATFLGDEATSTRNVYLLLGDTPAEVLGEYANLTGHPHLPPLWSFGYQQSHRTLSSQDEILSVAKTFRQKKLPCDAVIYLGTGFCPSGWNTGHGSFTFNEQVFPDPPTVIKQLHDEDLKVIVHIVPPGDFHGSVNDTGAEAEESGDAVPYWAKHLALAKAGIDGWWPDEGDRLSVYARLERNQMYWEGSRRMEPGKRPFALHRNGYAGLQRYGWLWSGDTFSTWDALKAQIMVGINIGLSGIPYWGTDTGGFVPTVEYGPELFVRWFQFSTFCPSFRSHGRAWKLHLPWGWGSGEPGPKEVEGDWVSAWPPAADLHRTDVEQICRKFLNLRYQLLPYIYSTAAQAHQTGMPLIRPLWLAFPHDEGTYLVDDSYMWGDNFFVAPMFSKGATERSVYLPQGVWLDYWTGERLAGGRVITAKAELDSIPLYLKAGAIVPTGPVKQHASEKSNEPVTLHLHPGADGSFSWYDDDGIGFAYEQGEYMLVHCEWDDRKHTLTLRRDPTGALGIGRQVQIKLAGTDTVRTLSLTDPESSTSF